MISWALTIDDHTGTHTIEADTATDRAAAVTAAADAVRSAILTAPAAAAEHPPRLTITIDTDVEFIVGMSTDALGKLDRDTALDLTDRYERDALTDITRNEAVGRGRAEPGE
ncbi:hypothetical protein ACFYVR_24920 [Rhodococcus sp. NPDC003318]|uniref:hypothetical protein n=1 Tax=Rhodococcus sp. NPDC003318 TaxID=3364503 RepID=UPI0036BEA921